LANTPGARFSPVLTSTHSQHPPPFPPLLTDNVYKFLILFFVLVGGVWAVLCPSPRAELARATKMLAERKARERTLLARRLERTGGALQGLELTSLASRSET